MKPIIEVKNFTKKYHDFVAVDDVSFEVEEGSIFAFLGPNGAGKSTTINTLCTILDKTSGTLTIDGKDLETQKDAVRKAIGIVFQDPTLDQKMTVAENLKMHCTFYDVPKKIVDERVTFSLELVDLIDWKDAPVGSLSGGMKRRVEIARALCHYPRVLFLDEPTTGLDPQTRNRMWEYIVKLQKEKNITIFLTTHYMDEAEICDRVAIMDGGKIIANDTPKELKRKYTKDEAYITTSNPQALEEILKREQMDFSKKEELYTVEVKEVTALIDLLSVIKQDIIDLEVENGTLNDVFLAITGKDIREGVNT